MMEPTYYCDICGSEYDKMGEENGRLHEEMYGVMNKGSNANLLDEFEEWLDVCNACLRKALERGVKF